MDFAIYEKSAKVEATHWWYTGRRIILQRVIDHFFSKTQKKNPRILAVGCGTGEELHFFSRYGSITGVDKNPVAVAFCKQKGFMNTVEAVAEDLPFPDQTFDLVLCLDVLEHVFEERKGLMEIRRVLKSGGLGVLTVPALPVLWSQADKTAHHFRRYRRDEFNIILRHFFSVCKISYFNSVLFFPIAAIKLLRRIFPRCFRNEDITLTPSSLNTLCFYLFSCEALILPHWNLPIGVSLLAIVEKDVS